MKVIFIVHTEYHILFALKIICAYHNTKDDDIIIQRMSPLGAKRLNQSLCFEGTNIKYRQLRYHNKRFTDKILRYELDKLANEHPDFLYVFHDNQKTFPYLFSKLKKYGTKIILGPDGANVYSNYTPMKERMLQFTFGNLYLWTNRFPSYLTFPSKHYACLRGIDAVVVESASTYRNYAHKEVIELSSDKYCKHDFQTLANQIFNYKEEDCIVDPGSIIWIDQPHEELIDAKRKFLLKLKETYPQKRIYIKPHPLGYEEEMIFFENTDGFELIRNNVPVELIIENLKDVNVISAHSTSMYYYNPSCRYFWVAGLFKELPERMCSPERFKGFKYIHVVKDFNEIKL